MSIRSDIRKSKALEAEAQKSFANGMGFSGMNYGRTVGQGWQYPGSLEALFYQMYGDTMQPFASPRFGLTDYRLIYEKIAPYANAIDIKRSLIGNPIIESKDSGYADEMNARLAELKSTGELRNAYATDKGIGTMLDELVVDLFVDGSAFVTFEDAQGLELRTSTSKLECVRVHDAARFDYIETGIPDTYVLQYIKQGIQTEITTYRDSFRVMQFDRTKYLWGKPLGFHTPFILRHWLVSLGAREQSNARIGAPLVMTLFGVPMPTGQLDPAASTLAMRESIAAANTMKGAYTAGIANRNRKMNQPVDVVGVVGADVKMSKHVYGEGIASQADFIEEFDLYMKFAGSSWGVPLVLTGLKDSSGGIGSEEFKYAAAFATNAAAKQQAYLDQNIVRPILGRYAMAERRNAPEYNIVWDGQTIEDLASIADTENKQAQANLTVLQGLELAQRLLSPAEQAAWAKQAGLNYGTF